MPIELLNKKSSATLEKALLEVSTALEEKMDQLLPEPENGEARVIEAMRYSTLSGGKRLRPFLMVASAGLFGVCREASLQTAAALEFIHTYSLVHDDLPAMDDDALRRGKPSCHIQFDEATAILAGDGLLTFAFQVLADSSTHPDPAVRCELIRCLAQAAGCRGMVGGQMIDLLAENKELSIDEVIRLQRLKTGELFAIGCEAGAILGKAPRQIRNALSGYAHDLGLAFQITDDLLDAEGSREKAGKEVRKDAKRGKSTFVSIMGIERARAQAQILAKQAINHLSVFDERAALLREMAEYVISRKS